MRATRTSARWTAFGPRPCRPAPPPRPRSTRCRCGSDICLVSREVAGLCSGRPCVRHVYPWGEWLGDFGSCGAARRHRFGRLGR
jgi:hypothetical protein